MGSLRDRPPKLPAGAGRAQRLIIIAWAAGAAGARQLSSLGQTLARHLLT